MCFRAFLLFALVAAPSLAAPASQFAPRQVPSASFLGPQAWDWAAGGTNNFTIHPSCNVTSRRQLDRALSEMMTLAVHARAHILRWGNSSTLYTKYFGMAPTAEPVGWYTKVVDGDKTGAIFRCDDPDMNCATQDGMFLYCQ